jgi:chromosomal replication initiation ATPase DnaA
MITLQFTENLFNQLLEIIPINIINKLDKDSVEHSGVLDIIYARDGDNIQVTSDLINQITNAFYAKDEKSLDLKIEEQLKNIAIFVSNYFNFDINCLKLKSRKRLYVYARYYTWALATKYIDFHPSSESHFFEVIGLYFNRDRTQVLHAFKELEKVRELIKGYVEIRSAYVSDILGKKYKLLKIA